MILNKKVIYKRAYKELYEIINILSKNEKEKIPQKFIKNLEKNLDTEYFFHIDNNKTLLEQNLLPETQALLIKMYEKYLCPNEDKEFWKKYDKMCNAKYPYKKNDNYTSFNSLEELYTKKNQNIIQTEKTESNFGKTQEIVIKKETLIHKIINKLKKFFRLK